MIHDPTTANLTNEELISAHRASPDHVVRELATRLADAVDEAESFDAAETKRDDYIERLEAEITDLQNEVDERDKNEERVAELEEQLAHETARIDQFHTENQGFIAEIDRLKTLLDNTETATMSDDQVQALIASQNETNTLLARIAAALEAPTAVPPTAATILPMSVASDTPPPPVYTLDDVRTAYMACAKTQTTKAAKAIVHAVAGDVKNITHVPSEKFGETIAALRDGAAPAKAAA